LPNLAPYRPQISRRLRWLIAAMVLTLGIASVAASLFAVDVTEYALVLRFGQPVRTMDAPGLYFKAPFDSVVRLDRRLTFSRPAPGEYLTVDKRNVVVESLATWRIRDPGRFFATVRDRTGADKPLADIVLGEVGAVLGAYPAAALIAPDGNAQRFDQLVSEIRERVAGFAQQAYGIEIVDIALLRLALPEQNREPVFERMKAERGKMAKEHRTAGELEARKIIASADRERSRIAAEAYEQAQKLKAEGDAEASKIYAAAFGRDASFYKFLRTLQAYEKVLDDRTTLFLPADAEVMRVLRPLPGSEAPASSPPSITTTPAKVPSLPEVSIADEQGHAVTPNTTAPSKAESRP
jgi:modulator of FtsH protease HflC